MRGIAFTFDAVFALIIAGTIIPIFLLLSAQSPSESINQRLALQAEDAIDVISRMRVKDIAKENVISDLYLSGQIGDADLNRTVLELVTHLWASNSTLNSTRARNITQQIFGKIIPQNVKWSFVIDNERLVDGGADFTSTATASRRIVSGFKKGLPSAGYVASAFLTNIGGKGAASYYFFGGFVGEGNISITVAGIPSDATVKSIYMEMTIGSNFTFYVNGNSCGTFNVTGLAGSVDNFTINSSSCLSNILAGANNTFAFNFTNSDVLTNFVGGGFLKVAYTTKQLTALQQNTTRFMLPAIEGLVNYFDSFYINGNITAMKIRISTKTDHDVLFNIGNTTVFTISSGNSIVEINNSDVEAKVNYTNISSDTVPIRIAPFAISKEPGVANISVILITDFSGSMKKAINDDTSQGSANINCNNVSATPDARKSGLAKCLDKTFVDIILNNTNNTLWPVFMYDDRTEFYDNPRNATAIKQNIDSYPQGKEKTCIACAINLAYDVLKNNTNPNEERLKFIVIMTDGVPTHCATDSCTSNSTSYGTKYCEGYCDFQGAGGACVYEGCSDNKCENPTNNTIYSANRSVIDQNITVYTIGFGLVESCSKASALLQKVADIGGGRYAHSSNTTELEKIYRDLANELVNYKFFQQRLELRKGRSTLKNDSYIDLNFTPRITQPPYQEISVLQETPQFNACNYSLFVPGQVRMIDAKATSFSGDFWTTNVSINNALTGGANNFFYLSKYGNRFEVLGDPFVVQIPENLVATNSSNLVNILLGTSPTNISSVCSNSSRIIYTTGLRASVPFGAVFPRISGGIVRVYYDVDHDGTQDGYTDITVGSSLPSFNQTVRAVEELDPTNNALDDAVVRILDSLNHVVVPANSGRSGASTNPIDIILSNVEIDSTGIGSVPFAWGPLDVTLEVGV